MDQVQPAIATIVSAPFAENSYIAHFEGRDDCLVIDPGFEPEKIFGYLEENQLTPAAFLITHGHADHIVGNGAMKERWPSCPIVIGREEAPKLTSATLNLSADFGAPITSPPADVTLEEGEVYRAAGFELEAHTIPGHSSGHMVFIAHGEAHIRLRRRRAVRRKHRANRFSGGQFLSPGRGRSQASVYIARRYDHFSGHGPATTVADEKEDNPYVGRSAGWRG